MKNIEMGNSQNLRYMLFYHNMVRSIDVYRWFGVERQWLGRTIGDRGGEKTEWLPNTVSDLRAVMMVKIAPDVKESAEME